MVDGSLRLMWKRATSFLLPFKGIVIIALIGLAIRFLIAPFTSWTYDMYPYYSAMVDSLSGLGVYGHVMYSYPPLFMVITYPFTLLLSLFQDPSTFVMFQPSMVGVAQSTKMLVPYVTSPSFNLAIKTPMIIGDLLAGLFIYAIVRDLSNQVWAKRAFILWFLNPLVILTGSIMGQFDVLPALMTLIAIYFAIKEKYLFVGLALGLGTLLKIYPAFLFFFYITMIVLLNREKTIPWITRRGRRQLLELVAGGAICLLTILPFFITSGRFTEVILRRTDYQQFGGFSIWSIWNVVIPGTSPDTTFPDLHLTTLIYVAILVASVLWAFWVVREKERNGPDFKKRMIKGHILFVATILVLQPLTNPQHLIWLLPLLLLFIPGDRRMELRFMVLSIIGALFLFSLQSFYALLYPLASYIGLVDIATLNQNIFLYYNSTNPLSHNYVLGIVVFSAMFCLYTIFLPPKFDPMTYLLRKRTTEESP
ncbi:MAG TPA: glycosyltransferase 87 family protein [Methanomassiliicoccales archaeon]|jgi:hypothetical protein